MDQTLFIAKESVGKVSTPPRFIEEMMWPPQKNPLNIILQRLGSQSSEGFYHFIQTILLSFWVAKWKKISSYQSQKKILLVVVVVVVAVVHL